MPVRHIVASDAPPPLVEGLSELADDLKLPREFPPDVLAETGDVIAEGPMDVERDDLTEVPFIALDPQGARDLDQILHIERRGSGHRVWYAIADVASWVRPGGAIDAEAHRRGQTIYAPTMRVPLHPGKLSEGAASLLADGTKRPAIVWRFDVDESGQVAQTTVTRAWVQTREAMSYERADELLRGETPEVLECLREVGERRINVEADRGGVSLNLPEQEIVTEGGWRVEYRESLPVEAWNAQISLMTGIAAATMMSDANVGILRTLPPARDEDVERLRRIAASLRLDWPLDRGYPEFVRSLDASNPDGQAMLNACTTLFRGAGYTVVTDETEPGSAIHAALATPYAHATAPLRRLVDRYVEEICVDLASGQEIPRWVTSGLDELPEVMKSSDQRAKRFERGVVNLVEAGVVADKIGQRFRATVISRSSESKGVISIPHIAVEASIQGEGLELGSEVEVVVEDVDVTAGRVTFRLLS